MTHYFGDNCKQGHHDDVCWIAMGRSRQLKHRKDDCRCDCHLVDYSVSDVVTNTKVEWE